MDCINDTVRYSMLVVVDFHSELQQINADLVVTVTSRKIKNQSVSPSDILFRTHHYEVKFRKN